jgi:integrase
VRPGELDLLRWDRVDFEGERIHVAEQYNSKTREFTLPENGKRRTAPLTVPARDALLAIPRDGDFCFLNFRRCHFTASARAYHWKAIRAATGWDGDLYLATRHFAGWYMVNVLVMPSEDVAIALGHEDGGELVRRRYGHRDRDRALDRVVRAYEAAQVRPLRTRREPA